MDRPEDYERPVSTVPEPRKHHGHKKISRGIPLSVCAATEGNVQVISKPGTQADVPTSPEILKAQRKEGLAKIDDKMEPQQLRAAPRNVAVAAEVPVDLPCKCVGPNQNSPKVRWPKLTSERGVCQECAVIGNYALPEQPGENQH